MVLSYYTSFLKWYSSKDENDGVGREWDRGGKDKGGSEEGTSNDAWVSMEGISIDWVGMFSSRVTSF